MCYLLEAGIDSHANVDRYDDYDTLLARCITRAGMPKGRLPSGSRPFPNVSSIIFLFGDSYHGSSNV